MAAHEEEHAPMFSRSGVSTSLGKCTEPLKTHVPESTSQEFRQIAQALGCSTSELLRDLVCLAVHGQTFGELSAADKKQALMGSGPELGQLLGRLRALSRPVHNPKIDTPDIR